MTDHESTTLRTRVWEALDTVLDPELDRSVSELGFVTGVEVHDRPSGCTVVVLLRLPTYFCAPNFAYMMAADTSTAVGQVSGVSEVEVRLEDHFAADEINAAVASRTGFVGAFPRHANGDLAELRLTFLRKVYLAAQGRLARGLTEQGWTIRQMAEARLRDLPDQLTAPLLRGRRAIGLPTGGGEPAFTDQNGDEVPLSDIDTHLKRGRATAVGIGVNTQMCEGLLATRYGTREQTIKTDMPSATGGARTLP